MIPRVHHTVQPDVRLPFNEWSEYIYEELFKIKFAKMQQSLTHRNYGNKK